MQQNKIGYEQAPQHTVELLHATPLHLSATGARTCWASHSKADSYLSCPYCGENCDTLVSDDGSYQCPQCARTINFPNLPTTIGINDKKLIERVGNKFKHACYSSDTEVLTLNGWKLIKDVNTSDKVCTLNPKTKNIEYYAPINLFEYNYDGELIHYKSNTIDLMVTPNHKIYASDGRKHKNRKYDEREFALIEASSFENIQHYHTKRSHGIINEAKYTPSFMKLVGFFIGSGSIVENTLHFHISEEGRQAYFKNICNATKATYTIIDDSVYVVNIGGELMSLFKDCYTLSKEKTIPTYILYESSVNELKALLDGYINAVRNYKLWDTKRALEISTTSLELLNACSILAVHIGKGFSLLSTSNKEDKKTSYTFHIMTKKLDVVLNSDKIETKPQRVTYNGMIYCLEVPNHILMVRRGQNYIWSGNSILEHINFTFKIIGVSRALLQELSRHRLASPSVESTRYTLKKLKLIESPNLDILCSYLVFTGIAPIDTANIVQLGQLIEILKSGVSNDLVKYSLPEAYKVNMQWTINMRSLQNFLYLRSDKSALWEIRQLARSIYEAVPNEYKYLLVESMRDD